MDVSRYAVRLSQWRHYCRIYRRISKKNKRGGSLNGQCGLPAPASGRLAAPARLTRGGRTGRGWLPAFKVRSGKDASRSGTNQKQRAGCVPDAVDRPGTTGQGAVDQENFRCGASPVPVSEAGTFAGASLTGATSEFWATESRQEGTRPPRLWRSGHVLWPIYPSDSSIVPLFIGCFPRKLLITGHPRKILFGRPLACDFSVRLIDIVRLKAKSVFNARSETRITAKLSLLMAATAAVCARRSSPLLPIPINTRLKL